MTSPTLTLYLNCHRVIGQQGALTGYAGGVERKRWLLMHEGYLLAR
ncbi:MGMT family protein [Yersinia enterocolitica]